MEPGHSVCSGNPQCRAQLLSWLPHGGARGWLPSHPTHPRHGSPTHPNPKPTWVSSHSPPCVPHTAFDFHVVSLPRDAHETPVEVCRGLHGGFVCAVAPQHPGHDGPRSSPPRFAFQHSYREVGILLLYLAVGVSVFSGVAYTAEKEEDVGFDTIPACWWWGTVSMTTVGYGDVVPVTVAGKLAASGCILGGILVVALPITIIFNKFSHFYRKQKALEAAVRNSEKKDPEDTESCSSHDRDSEALSETSLGRGSPDRRGLTPGGLPAP